MLKTDDITPGQAVIAHLKDANIRHCFEAGAHKTVRFPRNLHSAVASFSLGGIACSDMAHRRICAIRDCKQRDILHISFSAQNGGNAKANFSTAANQGVGTFEPLHGVGRVYPRTSGNIAVRDVHFEAHPRSTSLRGGESEVFPPLGREAVLGPVCPGIGGVVLVIVNNSRKAGILESRYVGNYSLFARPLISKKPPGFHLGECAEREVQEQKYQQNSLCHYTNLAKKESIGIFVVSLAYADIIGKCKNYEGRLPLHRH